MKKGLGKGLGALLDSGDMDDKNSVLELSINEIEPNTDQPRKYFDQDKLTQLSESIKEHGVVQPIIVKKHNDSYRIVAGERRWRAAKLADFKTIPVIVKDLSSKQVMEIALIENLQREDLNPIEEAEAYHKLMKEYLLTQEQLSKVVGKSRSSIANTVRLLTLSEKVKNYIIQGQLTSGHARTLVSLEDKKMQDEIVDKIVQNQLNVRDTEKLINQIKNIKSKKNKKVKEKDAIIKDIEDRLKNVLGTKVDLVQNSNKGKIVIEYYSPEELDRIFDIIYHNKR